MYGKIFDSIYDGTLRANWKALITFQQLIILSGPDGVVDMTPHAIHGRTGIPLDIIEEGLKHLAEPDPHSRSSTEEGRRIVLIDEGRPWGWRLVNHAYYKGLISREDKREKDRVRIADKRKNDSESTVSHGVVDSRDTSQQIVNVAHAYTDAYTDTKKTTLSGKPDGVDLDRVNSKPKEHRDNAVIVLNFLNEKTGRKYQPVAANIDKIISRFKEGYTPKQLCQIVAKKCREWSADEKMNQYLRPATLFNREKCAQYAGELTAPKGPK